MLNIADCIIIARNCRTPCPRAFFGPDAGERHVRCSEALPSGVEAATSSPQREMRIWGIVSEEDESGGFRVVLDDCWFLRLQYRGNTVALFDPHTYTLPELKERVAMVIRIVRRDPLLLGDGSFRWSVN